MSVNILLADDHLMVREGLKQVLELDHDIDVISEASDGYECLNLINKTHPDVVLLDINMPNLDGLQVLSIMKQQKMKSKVIMLTIHKDVDYLIEALDAGCDGYVLKDSDSETLKKAIFDVYNGETFIEPSLTVLLNSSLAERDVMKDKLSELTKREVEVLKLIASGMFNKEIASTLCISERTVKNHVSNIFKKIEVSDRNRLRKIGRKTNPCHRKDLWKGTILRPSCIQFMGCSRILVEGITIKNSPFWTIHPVYCDNVIVRSITIDSHYPNNDGCDPESTSNVLIEECIFRTGDDAIAIKAGRDADGREIGRPSKNIVIRNCLFQSECNGLCIGSEMSGGVENIYMDNIQIGTVKNALYFKSNRDRGGYIRNIQVSNITIERSKGAVLRFETNYFGFRGGRHTSQYENFRINNVKAGCSDHYAIFIDGYEEKPIKNIEIEHFHVQKAPHPYYLRCVENICLKATFVNGQNLPEYPKKQKERVILDVY